MFKFGLFSLGITLGVSGWLFDRLFYAEINAATYSYLNQLAEDGLTNEIRDKLIIAMNDDIIRMHESRDIFNSMLNETGSISLDLKSDASVLYEKKRLRTNIGLNL